MDHIKVVALAICLTLASVGHAQFGIDWNTAGNAGATGTSFVGTTDVTHLNFRTNNLLRMRLNRTGTYTIGAFPAVVGDGYVGLSPNNSLWNAASGGTGPFTRLHLHDGVGAPLTGSFRDWMQNGMTCTTNNDQMYVGHRVESGTDQTSAVIQWGDNEFPPAGPDLMKFIFTGTYTGSFSGPGALSGREIARMHPAGYFGVGDWQLQSLQPTERVDLLNGRLRIRQLPVDPPAVDSFYVMVVDRTVETLTNHERGVVKWADLNALIDCDWVVQSPDPHVSSVYTGGPCSWDMSHGVGIGLPGPKAKLHVYHTDASLLSPTAIIGDARFDYEDGHIVTGVFGQARPTLSPVSIQSMTALGVHGVAVNSKSTIGVLGEAGTCQASDGTAQEVIGVKGVATACENASVVVGVWGEGSGASSATNDWGMYVNGRGFIFSGPWVGSDENLKTNIELIEAPSVDTDPMLQLPVHSYGYNQDAFPSMHLPDGQHTGFLAQEVEDLIPAAVTSVTHPAKVDPLGNEIYPAVDFKAINPNELLPYLVLTVQRQQSELNEMREQLAACCAGGMVPGGGERMDPNNDGTLLGNARALTIQPNPFNEATTLYYTLEHAGRMQLLANSADGKQLKVLDEAQREAGQFQYEWNTTSLSPGVYYVTLLLDGEPIVKKAVKVQR